MRVSRPWNELSPPEKLQRHIESIAAYYFIVAFFWALLGVWAIFAGTVGGVAFAFIGAALFAVVAVGLRRFNPAARYACYALSVPLFFGFPIGTIVAVYSAIFLTKGKALFAQDGNNA